MYDSVNFRLLQSEAGGTDFISEIPCYLENVGEHYYDGEVVITGDLQGLKVSLNRYQLKVKDGSLCKWYLGDNFKTMGRGDTKRAIEKLSDILHLPFDNADITRLDIAQNFIVKHSPEIYLNHLGMLQHYKRCSMAEIGSLYYTKADGRLCFYNKNQEQKSKREVIPELYEGRNVLRYEQRYMGRIASQFRVREMKGALLYDEDFYVGVLNCWRDTYMAIQKINDISLNFQAMRTKQQFYRMGVLAMIGQIGGQLQMLGQISEAQKKGELTKKQAHDLRQVVKEVCKEREGVTIKNEAIKELDKKICDAVRYYR